MVRALRFPFQITDRGVAASSARAQAVNEQLEQLLFTMPGERVNRPRFGCGVQRLVFAGASPEAAGAAEYVVSTTVRRHMNEVLDLDAVRVTVNGVTLIVDILYTLRATGDELAVTFARDLEGPA